MQTKGNHFHDMPEGKWCAIHLLQSIRDAVEYWHKRLLISEIAAVMCLIAKHNNKF